MSQPSVRRWPLLLAGLLAAVSMAGLVAAGANVRARAADVRFEISYPAGVDAGPIDGAASWPTRSST